MPSDMTMKNLVPPSAHSKPNTTAICIQNFLFSGFLCARIPGTNTPNPKNEGNKDVTEPELESTETAMPHRTSMLP